MTDYAGESCMAHHHNSQTSACCSIQQHLFLRCCSCQAPKQSHTSLLSG
jgi:hypothetical protein